MTEAGEKKPSAHDLERLEMMIFLYLEAARLQNEDKANEFAMLVESFADEIGYDDHARLHAVHTQAEQCFPQCNNSY